MMNCKTRLSGLLLALLTSTAFGVGLDVAPAEPESPPASATVQGSPATGYFSTPNPDYFRQKLIANGIDPDSEQGRVITYWVVKIARDPAWRPVGAGQMPKLSAFWAIGLSPDDRLKVMRLLKDIATDPANDCRTSPLQETDFMAFAKKASPRTFEDGMEMLQIAMDSSKSGRAADHYSLADLLDAEACLNATPPLPPGTPGYPPGPCGQLVYAIDALDKSPEPTRERGSYDFLQVMSHGKAAFQSVLDDSVAYFDEHFDERRLPEAMRRSLPADGSRPLPYSRITVDAQWVNKTTPGDDAVFKDVFVNRRNNGVIGELVTADGWSDFTLSYRLASLRIQTVGTGMATTQMGTLEDLGAIAVANGALVPGESIHIAAPQPSEGGKSTDCVVGQSSPASQIFPSLKGAAIGLQCARAKKGGAMARWHTTWLPEYGILWTDSIDDEDGRTEAVIRNITIEGASQ
ncbi:hypothetical protein SAMN05216466_103334 [Paraburkholderia phenazinium]|uniref:Uncharacterized protein n=2 Tax=Paraburkholderia phenazinium TaxID=60549 RepID=A0A1G7U754_9BURK|nr:hypothetical protein SAMN05216466_103334 [Paraburkholderia phenazinium]